MTDIVNDGGIEQVSDTPIDASANVTPAPAPSAEKMLTQSEVNRIVSAQKHEAYQKGLSAAQQNNTVTSEVPAAPQQSNVSLGQNNIDYDAKIQAAVSAQFQTMQQQQYEQAQQAAAQQYATGLLNELTPKIEDAKSRYEDFDAVTTPLSEIKDVRLFGLANSVDNAGDVLYDLGHNPGKITSLLSLSDLNPALAQVEIQKLSNSIKSNNKAMQESLPRDPINQVRSSTTGVESGLSDLAQLKRQYRG